MEFNLYLKAILKHWWIVVLTSLTALAIALIGSYIATPIFRTTARFIVSPDQSLLTKESDVVNSLNTLDKRSIIATYAQILESKNVLSQVTSNLQLSPEALKDYKFATTVMPEANILETTVEGPDPQTVVLIANNIGLRAIEYIRSLYTVYNISFLDPADLPQEPIHPQPIRDGSLALVLGLGIGVLTAIVREQLFTPLEFFLYQQRGIDKETQLLSKSQFEGTLAKYISTSPFPDFSLGLLRLEGLPEYIDVMPPNLLKNVFRQITAILDKELRGSDVVGRYGKYSFAILLPHTPSTAAVSTLGRVQLALSKAIKYGMDGETLLLNPAIGIVPYTEGLSSSGFIERATVALVKASRMKSGLVLLEEPA